MRGLRRSLPVIAVALLVGAGALLAPSPARADSGTTVTVSGHVYLGKSTVPAEAGQVRVSWAAGGAQFDDAQSVLTDAGGAFSVPGLTPGAWQLQFTDETGDDWIADEPRALTIDGSSPTITINETMAQTGGLTGTVYLGDTSHPAGAGAVKVTASWSDGEFVSTATTDAAGHYSMSGLFGGYTIEFQDLGGDFASMWWQNAYTPSQATFASFGRGVVQQEDQILPMAGSMHGVIPSSSNRPVYGMVAHLLDSAGADVAAFQTYQSGDGRYAFTGIPAGTYRLQFQQQGPPSPYLGATALDPDGETLTVTAGQDLDLGSTPMLSGAGISADFNCFGCSRSVAVTSELDLQKADGSWEPAPAGSYRLRSVTAEAFYDELLPGTYRVQLLGEPGETCTGFGTGPALTSVDGENISAGDFTVHCVNPLLHVSDFIGDDTPDVLAVAPNGVLTDYDTDGAYHWRSQVGVNAGWQSINVLQAPGFAPGSSPLLALKPDGSMWLYPIDKGVFGAPQLVCVGWSGFSNVMSDGDWTGDGLADVMATDSSGQLWVYPGDGHGHVSAPHVVGTGWFGFTSVLPVGDYDGDGHADIVARTSDGRLLLYRGDGKGGWLGIRQLGVGFQIFSSMSSAGDYTGDGRPDLMAVDSYGNLWIYPPDDNDNLGGGIIIGSGWSSMRIAH